MSEDIRIYVACLASYNDGILHGEWIDLVGQDGEDLYDEIKERILKTSPCPNVVVAEKVYQCPRCNEYTTIPKGSFFPSCSNYRCNWPVISFVREESYKMSEEWAIHDYEGFGSYKLSEYESLDFVAELARGIEEHGEAFIEYASYHGWSDVNDISISDFEDHFCGIYRTEQEYAEEIVDECFDIPENIQFYFDYEKFAQDLFINDNYSIETSEGVAIFHH